MLSYPHFFFLEMIGPVIEGGKTAWGEQKRKGFAPTRAG
jgi:hypothetical protein